MIPGMFGTPAMWTEFYFSPHWCEPSGDAFPWSEKNESQTLLRDEGFLPQYFNKDPHGALLCQGGMCCNTHTTDYVYNL